METQERLKLYQQTYFFELERLAKLNSSITIPTGIVTILSGLAAYFFKSNVLPTGFICVVFGVAFIVLSIALAYAIYSIIRSYYGHRYEYMPTSKDVEKYWNQISQYHRDYPNAESTPEERFSNFLINHLTKCNFINTANNERKSSFLHKAKGAIIIALISSSFGLMSFHINDIKHFYCRVFVDSMRYEEVINNGGEGPAKPTATAGTTTD